MANTAAFCNSAKVDCLLAIVPNGNTLRMGLYLKTASLGPTTTVYSATGEVSGTNYTQNGTTNNITHANAAASDGSTPSTAIWTPSASITYANVTLTTTFDAAFLYDVGRANAAIAVFNFGDQTITAGDFTLTMPPNNASNALLRISN